MKKWIHYMTVLGCVCICASLGLAGTYICTIGKIQEREAAKRDAALKAVLPGATGFNDATNYGAEVKVEDKVIRGETGDGPIGFAAVGQAQGYSSKLKIMVGVAPDLEKTLGISVLSQGETPGLGAKVVEVKSDRTLWKLLTGKAGSGAENTPPWFQDQFRSKPVEGLRIVTMPEEDAHTINAITGATITSKAVVAAVNDAVTKIRGIR